MDELGYSTPIFSIEIVTNSGDLEGNYPLKMAVNWTIK
jgi:hypothetical protein